MTSEKKLVRVWDRRYNLRGQQFVAWNAGTFTIPADDPMAVELWDRRELNHQITVTVESTDQMAWWIDRMDRTSDGTLIVTCRPYVDILRDFTVPDWKLVEVWLAAEKRWKSQQPSDSLRTRIAAAIEQERNQWAGGDAASETLADAVIRELRMRKQFQGVPPDRIVFRYITDWVDDGKAADV